MMPSLLHAMEAEAAVLGALLCECARIVEIRKILPDGTWFNRSAHKAIYDAILQAADENGGVVDIIVLNQKLEDNGEIKLAGGLDRLVALVSEFPSAAHAQHYARLVRDKHLLFCAMDAGDEMTHKMRERPDLFRDQLSKTIRKLMEIRELSTAFAP